MLNKSTQIGAFASRSGNARLRHLPLLCESDNRSVATNNTHLWAVIPDDAILLTEECTDGRKIFCRAGSHGDRTSGKMLAVQHEMEAVK